MCVHIEDKFGVARSWLGKLWWGWQGAEGLGSIPGVGKACAMLRDRNEGCLYGGHSVFQPPRDSREFL